MSIVCLSEKNWEWPTVLQCNSAIEVGEENHLGIVLQRLWKRHAGRSILYAINSKERNATQTQSQKKRERI
jgi:hypothetical protein